MSFEHKRQTSPTEIQQGNVPIVYFLVLSHMFGYLEQKLLDRL
jgi:hypothetical protein